MAEEKESTSVPLSQAANGGEDPEDPAKSPPSSPNSSTRKVCLCFFLSLCVCLFQSAPSKLLTLVGDVDFELHGSTGYPC